MFLHYFFISDNSLEKSKSVENINKCDTRKRKKRPAPLPPSPSSILPEAVKEGSSEVDTKVGTIHQLFDDLRSRYLLGTYFSLIEII